MAPVQRARWSYRRRMELALALLADGTLDALVTSESAFEDLPRTMARLSGTDGDADATGICHRIRY